MNLALNEDYNQHILLRAKVYPKGEILLVPYG
jgi:hypothetical protein